MGLNKLEMLGSGGGGVLYIGGRIADPLARGTRGAHAPPPPPPGTKKVRLLGS